MRDSLVTEAGRIPEWSRGEGSIIEIAASAPSSLDASRYSALAIVSSAIGSAAAPMS